MINILKNISLFRNVDTLLLKNVIGTYNLQNRIYNKGKTVHDQNEVCSGIDVILSGKLVAYSLTSHGSETTVFEFTSGGVVGANLLFGDNNKYPLNIYSIEETSLIYIPKSAVDTLLKDQLFAIEFIKILSSNSQALNRKIAIYTQKSLRENLTNYLSAQANIQNSKTIYLPISKKQLADHLGVQRPSLFRELKNMKDEGLIEINNRIITLLI